MHFRVETLVVLTGQWQEMESAVHLVSSDLVFNCCILLLTKQVKQDFTEITFYSQVRIKTPGYFLSRKIKLIMSLNMFRF